MSADKLYLYFFSGTGNARQTALWMQEEASCKGWETISYELGRDMGLPPVPEEGAMVGFISPTHGFHFPAIMRRFIRRFPRAMKGRAFVMNTRAGLRIGKVFLPGLSGLVHVVSALVLRLKGYSIVGLQPVDLPSNWISIHPAVRMTGVKLMHERLEPKVKRFTGEILEGKRRYKALVSLPFDVAIIPIALGYLLVGRFFLAKTFFASHSCDNCGLCIESCAVGAIKEKEGRMFWTWRCESCMKCMNICPQQAIQTPHGFVALIIKASYIVFGLLLLRLPWLATKGIATLVISVIMILVLYLVYRGMHYLLRFRAIERLMVWTSLSWLPFWGRYHARKLKNKKP